MIIRKKMKHSDGKVKLIQLLFITAIDSHIHSADLHSVL